MGQVKKSLPQTWPQLPSEGHSDPGDGGKAINTTEGSGKPLESKGQGAP